MSAATALQALLAPIIAPVPLVHAQQNAPRPAKPYATLDVRNNGASGWLIEGGPDANGNATFLEQRVVSAEVQFFGLGAMDSASALGVKLRTPRQASRAASLGVPIARVRGALDATFLLNENQYEDRGILEFTAHHTGEIEDEVGLIETVVLGCPPGHEHIIGAPPPMFVTGVGQPRVRGPSVSGVGVVAVSGTGQAHLAGPAVSGAGITGVAATAQVQVAGPAISGSGEALLVGTAAIAIGGATVEGSGSVVAALGPAQVSIAGPTVSIVAEVVGPRADIALTVAGPAILGYGITELLPGYASVSIVGPTIHGEGAAETPIQDYAGPDYFAEIYVLPGPPIVQNYTSGDYFAEQYVE